MPPSAIGARGRGGCEWVSGVTGDLPMVPSMDAPDLMDRQVEIAPGQFKRLGDCTAEDLIAADELAGTRGEVTEMKPARTQPNNRGVGPA